MSIISTVCSLFEHLNQHIMENTTENAILQIVRIKDDYTNGDLGAIIKHGLMPSQFYVIEKKPKAASSFYLSLVEPTIVFTLTSSAQKHLLELLLSEIKSFDEIHLLGNRSMWIDDSEIQSVTELCANCRQMKEEHHIQFVVIDDFQHLPSSQSVLEGSEVPDAAYEQLCQLAKELDIVVVALLAPSVYHSDDE